MHLLTYLISLPFIYFISILPFPVLYLLSDVLYLFVYHIIGYRKEMVSKNIMSSFPEKTECEQELIKKRFYKFFCDWIMEMIKTITIGKSAAMKKCYFTNTDILKKFSKEKKKLIFVFGHMGNFELGGAEMAFNTHYKLQVIYKPLSNPYFDRLIKRKRTKFNASVIPMKEVFRTLLSQKEEGQLTATAFIADQTPSPKNAYWTTFLNQKTPVFWGTETISKKLNYPIIYISIKRKKRGVYEMTPELLCEKPKETEKGIISELHTRRLEKDIVESPEIWLWSHNRWKHSKYDYSNISSSQ